MNKVNANNIEIEVNGEKVPSDSPETSKKTPKKATGGKKKFGIVVLIIGILTLVAGVTLLLLTLLRPPAVRDADYLIKIGAWQLKDEPTVIWDFTEIGKGTLTTNFHANDYDFIWSMSDGTLKIETDWLYTLNDEYAYLLNQGDNELVLTSGEDTYTFVPAEYPANQDEEEKTMEEQ